MGESAQPAEPDADDDDPMADAAQSVDVAPPPPPRTFSEGRAALNNVRRAHAADYAVQGGSMFADLLSSPRYVKLAADEKTTLLMLPSKRRFYELSRRRASSRASSSG